MGQLTKTDLDVLIKEMNQRYQPEGKCLATPAQMNLMLKKLEAYTEEVQEMAADQGIDDDANVQQWALDMAAWQQRMAHYKAELAEVPKNEWSTKKGCDAIYQNVTAPLLDGIWYEILPGIVLSQAEKTNIVSGTGHPITDIKRPHPEGHSNPKPPDVGTPFTLGNQVLVYQEHQKERARLFWEDLKASARRLAEAAKKAGKVALPWGVLLLGTAAVVGVGYLIVKAQK